MPTDLAMCPSCKAAMLPGDRRCGQCGTARPSGLGARQTVVLVAVTVALVVVALLIAFA